MSSPPCSFPNSDGADDVFPELSQFLGENAHLHNDAGHHGHADEHDNFNTVRDAFAALPAIPTQNFEFSEQDLGFSTDFTGIDNNGTSAPPNNDGALVTNNGDFNNNNDNIGPLAPYNTGSNADDSDDIVARLLFGAFSPNTQARTVTGLPEPDLDRVYTEFMRSQGFQPKPTPAPSDKAAAVPGGMIPKTSTTSTAALTAQNYRPSAWEPELERAINPNTTLDISTPNSSPPPPLPHPIYPPFTGRFKDAAAARSFRKRSRLAPKSQATDIERVKLYGREYWVRRIYESMIDRTNVVDSAGSIHRTRFCVEPAFDPLDLEAAAHHVFDEALAVHERGWNRCQVYHKKVVRGKLTDVSENSLERRLARICLCLRQKKATVDDAMRGGVTLALLCDNPEARGFTKLSNNAGNAKRGERLRAAKKAGEKEVVQPEVGEYEEEDEDEDEEDDEEESEEP